MKKAELKIIRSYAADIAKVEMAKGEYEVYTVNSYKLINKKKVLIGKVNMRVNHARRLKRLYASKNMVGYEKYIQERI